MIRSLIAVALVLASISSASAQYFYHNGSLMDVEWGNGIGFAMYYVDPEPGLPHYVRTGTLFLDGTWNNNRINATARVFSSKCGTAEYEVTGYGFDGGFYVEGPVPKLDSSTCTDHGLTWNSPNARLYFYEAE